MSARPIDPVDHSHFAALAEMFGLDAEGRAWRAYAACRDELKATFFPERGGDVVKAKAVCAGCTVREPCLAAALRNGEKHGIWGGLSERERRRLRRAKTGRDTVAAAIVRHLEAHGTHHGSSASLAVEVGHHAVNVANTVTQMERDGLLAVDPPLPRPHGTRVRTITLKETTP